MQRGPIAGDRRRGVGVLASASCEDRSADNGFASGRPTDHRPPRLPPLILRTCYVSSTASLAAAAAAAGCAAERLLPARGDRPLPRPRAWRPAAPRPVAVRVADRCCEIVAVFGDAPPAAVRPTPWPPGDGPPPTSRCPATTSSVRPWLGEPSATRGRAAGQALTPPWLWLCDWLRR